MSGEPITSVRMVIRRTLDQHGMTDREGTLASCICHEWEGDIAAYDRHLADVLTAVLDAPSEVLGIIEATVSGPAPQTSADVEALLDAYDVDTAKWDSHPRHRQLVSDLRALLDAPSEVPHD